MHKQHFIVDTADGPLSIESNRVYGDYKVLHREFVLTDPHPDVGVKKDYKDGTPLVMFIHKDKKGGFPDLETDGLGRAFLRIPITVTVKEFGSGVPVKRSGHKRKAFYDFEVMPVADFAIKAGLVKPLKPPKKEKDA